MLSDNLRKEGHLVFIDYERVSGLSFQELYNNIWTTWEWGAGYASSVVVEDGNLWFRCAGGVYISFDLTPGEREELKNEVLKNDKVLDTMMVGDAIFAGRSVFRMGNGRLFFYFSDMERFIVIDTTTDVFKTLIEKVGQHELA